MKYTDFFDNERRQLAEEYNKKKNKNKTVNFVLTLIFLIFFFGDSYEIRLYNSIENIFANRELIIAFYIFSFYLIFTIFTGILDYYYSYKLDRKYDISNQNLKEWLIDGAKSFLLSVVFLYLFTRVYLYLIVNFHLWWLYLSVIAAIFSIIISFIFPTVLLPIFFKLESFPESSLKDRLLELVDKTGLEVEDIYEINLSDKINAANAAVMGLGSSRKIVLGDKLKENYTEDEIEAVLAHELGHHKHNDIYKNLLIQPIIVLASFYLADIIWPVVLQYFDYQIGAVYSLPLFLLFLGAISFFFSPTQLYLSRKYEKEADIFAIKVLDNAKPLASALAKLADESLAPLRVSQLRRIFKLSHLPIAERIEFILEQEDKK